MGFSYLHHLVDYLHHHPHIGGLITFAIAFLESLAIIGAVVPGSVTMTAIGALIGSGAMPMAPTIIWAILGAFCGDFLSYWVGAHFKERLRTMWPFRKRQHWLTMGEEFFSKHGGKSVVIGRFIGPVRSLVPLVAGLLQMSVWRFAAAAATTAVLWSVVYIFPGIVVGALSLELAPATATKFILIVLAIVAFSWIIFVVIHLFFKTLAAMIDKAANRCWQWLANHKTAHWITSLLSNSQRPNPHRQLLLALLLLICSCLFLWVLYGVVTHSELTQLNQPVYELLRSLRTRVGDDVMLAATLLGDKYVQLTAGVLIFAWMLYKRYVWAALHWLGVMILAFGAGGIIRHLYYSPRPTGLLHQQLSSSFPSGHAVLSMALFSFLAILIAQHLPAGRRKLPYIIIGFLIVLILLSRVYLSAHWLTDVIGGLLLGLICALFITLSYLRRFTIYLPSKKLSLIAGSIFLVVWLGYGISQFRTQEDNYTLYWPTVTMDTATWWKEPHPEAPLFILSRLGKPLDVMNVQWLGALADIKQALVSQGWQEREIHLNWKGSLNRLSEKSNPDHLPVLPWLYQNQPPVLLMTKPDANMGGFPLYFMLWKSNITLEDSQQTLWVGSVHYAIPHPDKKSASLSADEVQNLYDNAMRHFTQALKNHMDWKIWTISASQQPPVMWSLNWNGKLLLVKSQR